MRTDIDNTVLPNLTDMTYYPIVGRRPWLAVTIGVLELIVGTIMLFYPLLTGLAAMWVGGFIFLFIAGLKIYQLFSTNERTGMLWNVISVILLLILGIYMIIQTPTALGLWTLVVGVYLMAAGIIRTILSFRLRGVPGFGWALFNGIVSTILGALITFTWPLSSWWFFGTLVAIEFLITGWTMIAFGIASSRLNRKVVTAVP